MTRALNDQRRDSSQRIVISREYRFERTRSQLTALADAQRINAPEPDALTAGLNVCDDR